MSSCFEHVVNLAAKAFLSAISDFSKTRPSSGQPTTLRATESVKEPEDNNDNDDLEEDIQILMKAASTGMPDSDDDEDTLRLSQLLLKVRGFIAKVCPFSFTFICLFLVLRRLVCNV